MVKCTRNLIARCVEGIVGLKKHDISISSMQWVVQSSMHEAVSELTTKTDGSRQIYVQSSQYKH